MRDRLHIVLVRPELGANVGSAARAVANMGVNGRIRIVGSPNIIDDQSRCLAKHAGERLDQAIHFATLEEALTQNLGPKVLSLASTARIGSAHRPHPLVIREAAKRSLAKAALSQVSDILMVFGPEGSGLVNSEIDLCDWVVTIPSTPEYRSLNLAQAVLIFCYEMNMVLVDQWQPFVSAKPSQKERLSQHLLELAEQVGFILPGDPHKMRPRLEGILAALPNHIEEVKTLHGLIDQVIRSVKKGEADFKGRYKHEMKTNGLLEN